MDLLSAFLSQEPGSKLSPGEIYCIYPQIPTDGEAGDRKHAAPDQSVTITKLIRITKTRSGDEVEVWFLSSSDFNSVPNQVIQTGVM